jgi:NADH-quinone oxidoreductase subunit N
MPADFALAPVAPELLLIVAALALLLWGAARGNAVTPAIAWAGVATLALASLVAAVQWVAAPAEPLTALGGMVVVDRFALGAKALIAGGLAVALALSVEPMRLAGRARFEYPVLTLLAGVGMLAMPAAQNFIALYVAMEMQALALYVLVASGAATGRSAEAGMKYFLLGALASALMLFGVALLYGAVGSLDFADVRAALAGADGATGPVVAMALAFILAALGFKMSAAPFHMWTPDVYEGGPTRIAALLAIVPKIAAAAVLARLAFGPLAPLAAQWVPVLAVLSVASMAWGAVAGVVQSDLKRLMAYSAVGHMGYALLGVVASGMAGGAAGLGAVGFYLAIYAVTVAGAFAVILCMRRDGRPVSAVDDLAGLAAHSPWLAAAMAVAMLSLAGVPPLAGFFAKLVVFKALVDVGTAPALALAVFGVATTVVAAYYYLRVVKVMYVDAPAAPFEPAGGAVVRHVVAGAAAAVTLTLILAPGPVLEAALASAQALF